ncbi:lasso RiPP family leader peptide-containing protein [Porphyrobacter sp. YT40]|uniref:lasso RiPP family leader peptide-containing protein n=1 Tax=Porphyrobacter sp. YT40 TaxID=2547601 RepID=UPI0011445A0B|nr:lasso RiPP family leader peptide-containing protein [Porphyrobacter sp. YT40]QDH33858.1 lasso RiPP family leader peptide-containing protein [Porphyrobacter sp. YT40]
MASLLNNDNAKASYQSPKLAVYGGFAKLTAAGSGTFSEGPNQGPMAKAARKL